MFWSQALLHHRNRPAVKRLRICITTLLDVEPRQMMQAIRDIRMFGPQGLFPNGKGTLKECFRSIVLLLAEIHISEVHRDKTNIGMGLSKSSLFNRQSPLEQRPRLGVAPLLLINEGQIVQRSRQVWVICPQSPFEINDHLAI